MVVNSVTGGMPVRRLIRYVQTSPADRKLSRSSIRIQVTEEVAA
jgi:hypothetical protein